MLTRQIRRYFSKMPTMPEIFNNPTYYSENHEKCLIKTGIEEYSFTLNNKKINVYGLPIELESQALRNQYIIDLSEIAAGLDNQTLLLQVDPVNHLFEKRKVKNQILQQVKYSGQKQQDLSVEENPVIPQNINELRLEPYLLEMGFASPEELQTVLEIIQNKDQQKAAQYQGYFSKYFSTQTPEDLESEEGQQKLMELSKQIQIQILNNLENDQNDFVTLMVINILKGNPMILGDVPSLYQRIILGDRFSLPQLIDIYKQILMFMKDAQITEIEGIYQMIMGQIFQQPIDLYLYYIIQKLSMNIDIETDISCFIKCSHLEPLKILHRHFGEEGFMKNSTFQEFMKLKKPEHPIMDEEKLEKHAILENIFNTQLWDQPYIKNKFPYLNENYNALGEPDQLEIQKIYYSKFNKYQELKNKLLKL